MADEKTLTLILKARNLASREVDKLHGAFGRAGVGARRFGRVMMTLGKIGIFAVITAFVALVGVMGKATQMAKEEEKGINRLSAALKANVKGFDGNTDAIEKVISQRERLAFSDDELRQSLGTLVVATKSVDKALALQTVAMDVARLKSISLDDASKLLIKAQMGNLRALKELGIQLPKNASKTEILAAIQKRAAGQAEAFGRTGAAAQIRFQIALDNLMEDIGKVALPIMTKFFGWLTQHGIPAVRNIIASISRWYRENKPLITQVANFAGNVLGALAKAFGVVVKAIGNAIRALATFIQWIRDAIKWASQFNIVVGTNRAGAGPSAPYHPQYNPTGHRAMGGPVPPRSFLVAENGPELFTERGGTVTPNNRLPQMGGGGVQHIHLHIGDREVASAITPAVSRQMFYELQRSAPTLSRT